jgi:hypothetical protein
MPQDLAQLKAQFTHLQEIARPQSWSRHAPHLDSAEVIDDLYYLFEGLGPSELHHLDPVPPAH